MPMKVKDLLSLIETHGISPDTVLTDSEGNEIKRCRLELGRLMIGESPQDSQKVNEVVRQCQCLPDRALSYLERCRWNVPLAIVTYQRENR
jgi:hypothetical protein